MQNDIMIETDQGTVLIEAGKDTFGLRGPEEAIKLLQTAAPVLQPEGNSNEIAGDVLARLVYLNAQIGAGGRPRRKLRTQEEMVKTTLTQNPLVMLQVRSEAVNEAIGHFNQIDEYAEGYDDARTALAALKDAWTTTRVFLDIEEAREYVEAQPYRYEPDNEDRQWRLYTGIAEGVLKRVAKQARDLANY